jgi:hypothetical protein
VELPEQVPHYRDKHCRCLREHIEQVHQLCVREGSISGQNHPHPILYDTKRVLADDKVVGV